MVARFLGLALLLAVAGARAQIGSDDSPLTIELDKPRVEWGRYVRATVVYTGAKSLEMLDFSPWTRQVAIHVQEEESYKDEYGRRIERMVLRLYPRGPGTVELAPLQLGVVRGPALRLEVAAPKVRKTQVDVRYDLSTPRPFERQAVSIRVRVSTSDLNADVLTDEIEDGRIYTRLLRARKTRTADGVYVHELGWRIYPLEAGALALELPAVRYRRSGSTRRRFFLPVMDIVVKPVPAYVPPTVPVGRLDVASAIETPEENQSGWLPAAGSGANWRVSVTTDGLMPAGLPGLDAQLAELGGARVSDISVNTQTGDTATTATYRAPLPAWWLPAGNRKRLSLRYFDAGRGRVVTAFHDLPGMLRAPAPVWAVLGLGGLLLAALVARIGYAYLRARRARREFIARITGCTQANQLRQALLGDGRYRDLGAWMADDPHGRRTLAARKLNAACYSGRTDVEMMTLKDDILKAI